MGSKEARQGGILLKNLFKKKNVREKENMPYARNLDVCLMTLKEGKIALQIVLCR